jgi:soluble lytic murein transglycosylase-like protein
VGAPRLGPVLVAVAVAAAVAVWPRSAEREPGVSALAARGPACAVEACEPGQADLVDRIDARLASRMAGLEPELRLRLARTVVLDSLDARIDPLLVLALIEVESSFDAGALSASGARGLMQLREATMRRELERHGLEAGDPHDPVANVQAGVRYLRRLLDAFGREDVALMAYNAGPNRILGYLREGEIPARFHDYPRRVKAELRRLRRDLRDRAAPRLASAGMPRMAE